MSAAFFGGSWHLVQNGQHPLRTRIIKFMKRAAVHQVMPWLRYIPGVPAVRDPELNQIIENIIATRGSKKDEDSSKTDLLQLLVAAHNEDPVALPAQDIHSEMMVFLLAGAETTSTVLTFVLLFLLNNYDKMQTLLAEINHTLPEREDVVSTETTRHLSYLNAVINEAMRLMPPAAGGKVSILALYILTSCLSGFFFLVINYVLQDLLDKRKNPFF